MSRIILPSVQIAQRLRRPVQHEDVNPAPLRAFLLGIARQRGWMLTEEMSSKPVTARLDAGRWLADCPLECGGAEMVSESDPVFLCLSCGSGMQLWPVIFPGNKSRIEAEVVKRANPMGWAWNLGETMAQLRTETRRLNK